MDENPQSGGEIFQILSRPTGMHHILDLQSSELPCAKGEFYSPFPPNTSTQQWLLNRLGLLVCDRIALGP